MKTLEKFHKRFLPALIGLAAFGAASSAYAATVGVVSNQMTNAFRQAFETPANGNAFVFQESWFFALLSAEHTPGVLTLGAAPIDDPDPFWYSSGAPGSGAIGNKEIRAFSSANVPDLTFAPGELVTFEFEVLSNTLLPGYSVEAYIRDFTSDFLYFEDSTLPVNGPGSYSLDLTLSLDPALNGHTEWGFAVIGPNVWSTDVDAQGNIQIASAVPVPAAVWLFGSGLLGLVGIARRRKAVE